MPKKRNRTLIRVMIAIPYLLLLFILQSTVFTHITLWGVKPLILPLAVTGIALFRGRVTGGVFGIFAGMLCDISYNQVTVQFTILLALVGLFIGILSENYLTHGYPSYLVCSFITLVICGIVQTLPMVFFHGMSFFPILGTTAAQTLYSLIFTLPIYYISRYLSRII